MELIGGLLYTEQRYWFLCLRCREKELRYLRDRSDPEARIFDVYSDQLGIFSQVCHCGHWLTSSYNMRTQAILLMELGRGRTNEFPSPTELAGSE